MYFLLLGLQYIGVIAIVGLIVFIISRQHTSDGQALLIIMCCSLLINFVGYILEMQARTMQEALYAVKFTYFGKPYIALGMLFFILYYCEKKIPKWISISLVLMHLSVTFLVLFCEHNKLYYSSIAFVEDGMFPHLECGHGIAYILYHCLVSIYLIVMVVFCTEYMIKNKKVTERRRTIKLMMIPVIMIIGLVPFLLGKTKGYDSTLIAYLFCLDLVASVLIKDKLLDTLNLAMELAVNDLADGLLVLNNENEVIYSNKKMHSIYKLFDEKKTTDLLYELDSCLLKKRELQLTNQVYSVSSRLLTEDNHYYGKMYILTDKTQQNNYTQKLVEQTAIMKGLKEQAEEVNRIKTALVSTMSHEIQLSVNTIVDTTDRMMKDEISEQNMMYLNTIKKSGNELLIKIDDILEDKE